LDSIQGRIKQIKQAEGGKKKLVKTRIPSEQDIYKTSIKSLNQRVMRKNPVHIIVVRNA